MRLDNKLIARLFHREIAGYLSNYSLASIFAKGVSFS